MEKTIEKLSKLVDSPTLEVLGNNLIIAAKRPVIIKAKLEKLINEKKIEPGKIIQYNNAVVFQSGNSNERLDIRNEIDRSRYS